MTDIVRPVALQHACAARFASCFRCGPALPHVCRSMLVANRAEMMNETLVLEYTWTDDLMRQVKRMGIASERFTAIAANLAPSPQRTGGELGNFALKVTAAIYTILEENMSISRRQVLFIYFGLFASAFCVSFPRDATSQEVTAEQWMESWIGSSKPPIGALHVSRFVEPLYFLTKQIAWKPEEHQKHLRAVVVPVGFLTDFASVPRVFWSLVRPDGEYSYAAILHDYLYWIQDRSREDADLLFKVAMEEFSINQATVDIIYQAVRLSGESFWKENARKKAAGEKRILREFPKDPRTRWEEWKRKPERFR